MSWQNVLLKFLLRPGWFRVRVPVAFQRVATEAFFALFRPDRQVRIDSVDVAGCRAEWLVPPCTRPGQAILYLHGGAFKTGSLSTHRALVARLALVVGVRVLNLQYRLAPEHHYPAAVEDAFEACRWLHSEGFVGPCLALAGDSAGGGLVVSTLLALREAGEPMPACAALFSPWVDLAGNGGSWTAKAAVDLLLSPAVLRDAAHDYLGEVDPHEPLASATSADLTGLPPLLVLVGTEEILLDDARRLVNRARAYGVEAQLEVWSGMVHDWPIFAPWLPEGKWAIERAGTFLRRRMAMPTVFAEGTK